MAKPRKLSIDLDLDLDELSVEVVEESFRPKCFGDYDNTVCGNSDFICGEECGQSCIALKGNANVNIRKEPR